MLTVAQPAMCAFVSAINQRRSMPRAGDVGEGGADENCQIGEAIRDIDEVCSSQDAINTGFSFLSAAIV
jgi:hypothetical protein